MTEAVLVRKIKLYLKSIGALVIRYHGGPYSEIGVPDLIFALQCKCCRLPLLSFCEVKTPRGIVSPAQKRWLSMAKSYSCVSFVAISLEDVKKELRLANFIPVDKVE